MALETHEAVVAALSGNSRRLHISLAPSSTTQAAAPVWLSNWKHAGGATPTSAALCTDASAGALCPTSPIPSGAVQHLDSLLVHIRGSTSVPAQNGAARFEIHDRLAHMGGLSGTVTTSQGALSLVTTDPGADRIGPSNYSEVHWWLEMYSAIGTTTTVPTVAVEYDDGSTGNALAMANLINGGFSSATAGYSAAILPAVAGRHIRAVTGVTLSASSGAAGNFGITATRSLTIAWPTEERYARRSDWAKTGRPQIPSGACLQGFTAHSGTSPQNIYGSGLITIG